MGLNSSDSPLDRLVDRLGRDFPTIRRSRDRTAETIGRLRDTANDYGADRSQGLRIPPPDGSIVLLGSLARAEYTAGSDVDWTLLIDGQADPKHKDAAREFRHRLQTCGLKGPTQTGAFGGLSFSHDLIHCIGGEHDTNSNMTRRILLLLESTSLTTVDAHSRVLRGILDRYVASERSFLAESGLRYKVPRFLLNDIVRYWRTMAVDYVSKQWERGDRGWALRNIKLRFSRKLTFVSGLLTCFGCYLDSKSREGETLLRDRDEAQRTVLQYLTARVGRPPMDILCEHLLTRSQPRTSVQLLESYSKFLDCLDDRDRREHLETLPIHLAYADVLFNEMRTVSHAFQAGFDRVFYEDDSDVRMLMRKYGVF